MESHTPLHHPLSYHHAFMVDATDIATSLSVHATKITSELGTPCRAFDRVIWNFPHTGEQRVHLNRNLIREFLEKVPGILSKSGRVYITLNWKPPYSLWNLDAMLPDNLHAEGYLKFSPKLWPGYGHQTTLGGRGGAKSVEEGIDGGRSYVFMLTETARAGTDLHAFDAAAEALTLQRRNTGVTRPSGLRKRKGSGEGMGSSSQWCERYREWLVQRVQLNSIILGTAALVGWRR